jgi:hypothetical protein
MALEAQALNPAFSRALRNVQNGRSPSYRGLNQYEVGDVAEITAATALLDHPDINRVVMFKHFSPQDLLGHDLKLRHRNGVEFFAQVKASDEGRDEYLRRVEEMLVREHIDMSVEAWITMKRLVVIVTNGKTKQQIRDSVDQQLTAILEAHGEN